MNVGSLFTGIGGFDLGLERAGMRIVWQCEAEPYRRAVLRKHWPDVPIYDDVTTLNGGGLEPVDVLCGGFPCQDLSLAGKGAGIDGDRSGLWSEFARLIGELRPRYVVVENVTALLGRGVGRVFGDLAACGYDAEWDCIPAAAVGAPHRRDRIWIVAYPAGESQGWSEQGVDREGRRQDVGTSRDVADPEIESVGTGLRKGGPGGQRGRRSGNGSGAREADKGRPADNANGRRHRSPQGQVRAGRDGTLGANWWATEPDVGRVADGVPARVDRLSSLGDALVPQIAEWIGRQILAYESQQVAA